MNVPSGREEIVPARFFIGIENKSGEGGQLIHEKVMNAYYVVPIGAGSFLINLRYLRQLPFNCIKYLTGQRFPPAGQFVSITSVDSCLDVLHPLQIQESHFRS